MHRPYIWRALTRNVAATSPGADDPRLVGRTYTVPFERVWRAALALADDDLPRWRVLEADDEEGVIRAEAKTLVVRMVDDVTISIRLDENAQTRVDVRSCSRKGRADLGKNARRIGRFLRALDDALASARTAAPTP